MRIDWLVSMRRLRSDRMLDVLIARGAVSEDDLRRLACTLAAFYEKAQRVRMNGSHYRQQLTAHLHDALKELTHAKYGLQAKLVEAVIGPRIEFLGRNPRLFDRRAETGKIIDGHGDLRPEHICLDPRPVIIDCLEFNRGLRVIDTVSELMFLALECERLGAPHIGTFVLEKYCAETGDQAPEGLLEFYRAYHAFVRAKIAIWHLRDAGIGDRDKWITKASEYLTLTAGTGKPASAA